MLRNYSNQIVPPGKLLLLLLLLLLKHRWQHNVSYSKIIAGKELLLYLFRKAFSAPILAESRITNFAATPF
ncbi:hypothetical protein [Pontibacter beigongshangensis]|uniref:hypothetical protein n=1 Tax=Pontibacter beigongshangensis TaxID=2574733 RepID=UPI00164FC1E4|nr:hypothetical protein [Pontibacter beigongshangensis]